MRWQSLADDSGRLVKVQERPATAAGRFEALSFIFERGVLRLAAISETDEVAVHVVPVATDFDGVDSTRLRPLLGTSLECCWMLTNHRGYQDAFQMRFLDHTTRAERTWQVEVAASALDLSELGS